jgi:Uma2 family endonuclease
MNAMAETAIPLFHSLDDFLAWEEQQELRHELLPGGVITMMAGGSGDHDLIAMNIGGALRLQLRGTGCVAHGANLKVMSERAQSSVYPDVFVRCGPPVGEATRTDDPVVVFEVMSESTARNDLTRKRQVYKAIPSVKVIVYVSQGEYRLDVLRRMADGRFDEEVLEGADAVLKLPEIAAELSLAEIYEDTSLAAAAGDSA